MAVSLDITTDFEYDKCSIFAKDNIICGANSRAKKIGLFLVGDLVDSANAYLDTLKLVLRNNPSKYNFLTERLLIENRLGRKLEDTDYICANHRYSLGFLWKARKACQHPNHKKQIVQKKSLPVRCAPIEMCEEMCLLYNAAFPIGTVLCKSHLNEMYLHRKTTSEIGNHMQNDAGESSIETEKGDNEFEPQPLEKVLVESDISVESENILQNISMELEVSPVKYQVNKTDVTDLSESNKRYLKRKYKEAQNALKKKFLKGVAPFQESEMEKIISSSEKECSDSVQAKLKPLIEMYKNSDAFGQIAVLSLVDHEQYSRSTIMDLFNCSKYKVDTARKLAENNTGIHKANREVQHRMRLDVVKCEHFLDFIFSRGLLQDAAYGVRTLKYDSGSKQDIPHSILTIRFNYLIALYVEHCTVSGYTPLSETTLWRILRSVKPSTQKSLSGLDNITADGLQAFATLSKISKEKKMSNEIINSLEMGKRYLKTKYPSHCEKVSEIASHCISCGLSDPKKLSLCEPNCTMSSTKICEDCHSLSDGIDIIIKFCQNEGDKESEYDSILAKKDIMNWMKHIIRDVQQQQAKSSHISKLSEERGYWLKDYAQKVLPIKSRESQREYFGKKGITLHIDVFFFADSTKKLKKIVYFTAIFRCAQTLLDTLCIGQNVLRELKTDMPQVKQLYCKSDNAGSYHGNHAAEVTYNICKDLGIVLLRIDFNEPQKGKDQCDRESAIARNLMKQFVDAGNDIISAEDVYTALHFSKGVKNGKITVVEIDKTLCLVEGQKIPYISIYHSVEFERTGMRFWRYFEIGVGEFVPFNDVKFTSGLKTIKPFSHTSSRSHLSEQQSAKERLDRSLCTLKFCSETGCKESFNTAEELDHHILFGLHTHVRTVSGMDCVRKMYSEKLLQTSYINATNSYIVINTPALPQIQFNEIGWALPLRAQFKFTSKQKQYLLEQFMIGENTGKKQHPSQVAHLMRNEVRNGKKLFTTSEYCTMKQIQSLFSRWKKQKDEGILNNENVEESEHSESETEFEDDVDQNEENIKNQINQFQKDGHLLLKTGNFVALRHGKTWYPGEIVEVDHLQVKVKCMAKTSGINKFVWPEKKDEYWYDNLDILCTIDPPVPISNRAFSIQEKDALTAQSCLC